MASPAKAIDVCGRHRRAGLSVRLAHQLHCFLESQEKSRFEELKLELLLQEKLWAVEQSKLERELGSFGISNASHTPRGPNFSEPPIDAAMVWRSRKGRETGCSCADCWGTSISHGSCIPCRSATAQTGQLIREIGETASVSAPSVSAGQVVPSIAGIASGEQVIPEDFQDFREHLKLLLAARASVMAAEASLRLVDSASSSVSENPLNPLDLGHLAPEVETQKPQASREADISIRSAGLKQLLALKPVPSAQKHGLTDLKDGGMLKEVVGFVGENDPKGTSDASKAKFQEHLSNLNDILSVPVPDESAEGDVPEPDVPAFGAREGETMAISEEITQEFANSFLQLAEERAATDAGEIADKGEATDAASVSEVKPPSDTLETPKDAEAQPVENVESPPRHSKAWLLQADPAPAVPDVQGTQVPQVPPMAVAPAPQSFADRSAARKQKVLQWKKAAEFLKGDSAELLLEVDFAKRKVQEMQKHRQIKRRLIASDGMELSAGWLHGRMESAEEVLRVALQPPWEKQEQLEKMQKIQRLLHSSRRGRSQIFHLTACVEAVVAGYDTERSLVLDACEQPDEVFESQEQEALRRERGDLAVQALEREVAKALRSISECRRLLLDLCDKGAIETKSENQQSVQRASSSKNETKDPKVDERRRSEWARVYADLLQIEAKDSTTITIKTSQGVAWAKT